LSKVVNRLSPSGFGR